MEKEGIERETNYRREMVKEKLAMRRWEERYELCDSILEAEGFRVSDK